MENASNALIMAAGILISVILISLGTWLFTAFGGYSKTINNNLSQTQIEEFNAQFTKYETTTGDETTYCTAYDIVSVINLAKDANEKYGYNIGVTIGNHLINISNDELVKDSLEYISNADGTITTKQKQYKCTISYGNSIIVSNINFTQIN